MEVKELKEKYQRKIDSEISNNHLYKSIDEIMNKAIQEAYELGMTNMKKAIQ